MLELKVISAKERAMRGLLYGFAAALFALGGVWPAGADERPVLQLDTGGHMAKIWKIAFTPDGKQLVSAGEDKVIRVWDVATGKTLRTIRGEIAPGNVGQIYAMALSPDGKWLAAGGWTGGDEIRLYNFASGELKALLKGHTSAVNALTFSPDGKRMISGSADTTAILWDMSPLTATHAAAKAPPAILKPLHQLKGHTDYIFAAGITPGGAWAATGAYDKDLRLWRVADGTEIAVMKGHADRVFVLAIASGGTIASGDDSGEIRLWNGETGAYLRTLAQQGTVVGSLSFSPDGKTLLSSTGAGTGECHVWDVATGRELVTYREHDNIVIATAISADGRWAATGGGANHAIHIWDLKTGKRRAAPDGAALTLGGTGKPAWAAGFSADGKMIGWGNTWTSATALGKNPLEFALALPLGSESLGAPQPLEETAARSFRRAVAEQDGWSLSRRKGGAYGYDAILEIRKGKFVEALIARDAIDGYGHSSYTFTPDGQTIISGGESGILAAYDRAGQKLGEFVGHEGDPWALALSPDGKYLVSGSADQTVRLWDVKTRALLATLFHGSDGEWVIWTPEGFFAGSEKGAERVGWHINQGPDKAARYVTGAQLRKAFFRPDLVAQKIACAQEGEEAEKACRNYGQEAARYNLEKVLASGPPPEVQIVAAVPGEDENGPFVTVTARILEKQDGFGKFGGIGRIEAWVNGQSKFGGIGGLNAQGERSIRLDLASTQNSIELFAWNKALFVTSPRASTSVSVSQRALDRITRNLYILALGVNKYKDHPLHLAVRDAQDLSATLAEAGKDVYRDTPMVVALKDEEVTAGRVGKEFEALGAKVKAADVFVFYIAGHGKTIEGNYYFVPAGIEAFTDQIIKEKAFGSDQWKAWLNLIKAEKSIWFIDTCEAGSARSIFNRTGYVRLKEDLGRTILMAASEQQAALEGVHDHVAFTYTLLEGLANANLPGEDEITLLG
jgi:WD40 repeat protein